MLVAGQHAAEGDIGQKKARNRTNNCMMIVQTMYPTEPISSLLIRGDLTVL
jgi:hypothetical protein